jgi:hypothetical protein
MFLKFFQKNFQIFKNLKFQKHYSTLINQVINKPKEILEETNKLWEEEKYDEAFKKIEEFSSFNFMLEGISFYKLIKIKSH